MLSACHTVGTLLYHWLERTIVLDKTCMNYFSVCFNKTPWPWKRHIIWHKLLEVYDSQCQIDGIAMVAGTTDYSHLKSQERDSILSVAGVCRTFKYHSWGHTFSGKDPSPNPSKSVPSVRGINCSNIWAYEAILIQDTTETIDWNSHSENPYQQFYYWVVTAPKWVICQ